MTKNPLINALAALAYNVLVVLVMNYVTGKVDDSGQGVIVPVALLSVFTLSAAVMGYIFLLQPLQIYFEGDKRAGVVLFLQTVGVFAGITLLVLAALLSGVFSDP